MVMFDKITYSKLNITEVINKLLASISHAFSLFDPLCSSRSRVCNVVQP